ncbi:MAG: cytochrome c [Bacteroidota bacterium]
MKSSFTKHFLLVLALMVSACQFHSEKKENYTAATKHSGSLAQDSLSQSIQRGEVLYMDFCVTCHQPDGKGVSSSFPPLANADYLFQNREESIRSVKYGQQGKIVVNGVTYNGVMAPMGLEDDEVADVMNYIMNSWGNSQEVMVTANEVSKVEQ